MRSTQYHYLAAELQQRSTAVLLHRLRPRDFSRRCPAVLLVTCLLLAAARRVSLSAIAAVRRGCPSRETLRKSLLATLPGYDALRRDLPTLLRDSLPRGLSRHPGRRRYPLAIDGHRVAYYKRGRTPPPHVRKGQRHAGTVYGHDYATVSLLRKGQYYVLAATPYDPGEGSASLVRRLLRQAAKSGFSPRYVLLDRSFWSADVMADLRRAGCPFLIPVLGRGRRATAPGGPTSTRRFVENCPTGWYRYRITNRRKTRSVDLTIVVRRRRHADSRGRRGWAYAMWGMDLSTVSGVQERYRRRFRIESSYRLLETGRARTSSRSEAVRLWYVILAMVLVNLWLTLRREASQKWGPRDRAWYPEALLVLGQVLLEIQVQDTPLGSAHK
jgi:putative transposase